MRQSHGRTNLTTPNDTKGRTERIGQLLAVAAGAAQTLAAERLRPLGLSPRGWGVLSTLVETGPLTQVELANATATDRTAMVYLLDELEQATLVERSPNPDDRRSYLVRLTPAGARLQRKAAAELVRQREKLFAPLSAEERRELVDLLTRIADHWEELNPVGSRVQRTRSARALEALGRIAESDE